MRAVTFCRSTCVIGDGWAGIIQGQERQEDAFPVRQPRRGASRKCRTLQTDREGKDYAFVHRWFR